MQQSKYEVYTVCAQVHVALILTSASNNESNEFVHTLWAKTTTSCILNSSFLKEKKFFEIKESLTHMPAIFVFWHVKG